MSFATPEREFYSPKELEAISGLSHATIYRLMKKGKLVAKKLGAKTLISSASYRELVAELPPAGVQPSPTRKE